MKKQKIQLILLLVILLLLGVFLLLVKRTDIFKEKEEESITYDLMDAGKEDVVGLSYYLDGEKISLVKSGDNWVYEKDKSINLDESKVEDMVENATSITSDTCIEAAEALSAYGLEEPANTITVTLNDGSAESYYIGSMENMSYKYYAKTDKDDKIYLVNSSYSSAVAKSIEDITVKEETESETSEG